MKNFKIRIAALLTALLCLASPALADTDTTKAFLGSLGVMQGDENGEFNDSRTLTREQFAKITVRIADPDYIPTNSTAPFYDVPAHLWSSGYIERANALGYFHGYPDGSFRPYEEVLPEHVCKVMLTLLGYENENITADWASSQIAFARGKGLLKDVPCSAGVPVSRLDTAKIIENTLTSQIKDSPSYLVQTMGYLYYEDVVLISDSAQSGYVTTSIGTLKKGNVIRGEHLCTKGDIVADKKNEIIAFLPASQTRENYVAGELLPDNMKLYDGQRREVTLPVSGNILVYNGAAGMPYSSGFAAIGKGAELSLFFDEAGQLDYIAVNDGAQGDYKQYIIKSALSDGVMVFGQHSDEFVKIDGDISVYEGSLIASYRQTVSSLSIGDRLTVYYNSIGDIKYVSLSRNAISEPGLVGAFSLTDKTRILRDGMSAAREDIEPLDICYYIAETDTLLVYTKRITGVYENAYPTKDNIESISVSGKIYSVTYQRARSKLSGSIAYGDAVTLLFGKDDTVVDVRADSSESVTGFLMSSALKERLDESGTRVSEYVISVMLTDGTVSQYSALKDYSYYKGNAVSISFQGGKAAIALQSSGGGVSGTFDWDGKTLGHCKLAAGVNIIDTDSHSGYLQPKAKKIYPQRLAGAVIGSGDIIYANIKNGAVQDLILDNYTGDLYDYGMVCSAQTMSSAMSAAGNYQVNVNGSYMTFATVNKTFDAYAGQGVKARIQANKEGTDEVITMQRLDEVSITGLDGLYAYKGKEAYRLSDDVIIYKELNDGYRYEIISESGIDFSGQVTALYDKGEKNGGRVRIIVSKKS